MEDEGITIDHLLGDVCILDKSVKVTVGHNQKNEQLELQTQEGRCYFIVNDVIDMMSDGGFKLRLTSPRTKKVFEAVLIKETLFERQRPKRHC